MARLVWEGHLRLSLVTCPVALFKATSEGETVHLHLLHPETHNRVKQAWKDPSLPEGEQEVARSELLHGYEVEDGEYVIIEDEDLKSVRLESTRTIQIERFVDATTIDRLFWDQPYYLAPSGKKDLQEPFAVIRDAMVEAGRVALGRVVMTGRERTVAIEPRGAGLLLTTLHAHQEVRPDAEVFDGLDELKADPQMIEIARGDHRQAGGDVRSRAVPRPLCGGAAGPGGGEGGRQDRRLASGGRAREQRGGPDGGAAREPERRRRRPGAEGGGQGARKAGGAEGPCEAPRQAGVDRLRRRAGVARLRRTSRASIPPRPRAPGSPRPAAGWRSAAGASWRAAASGP